MQSPWAFIRWASVKMSPSYTRGPPTPGLVSNGLHMLPAAREDWQPCYVGQPARASSQPGLGHVCCPLKPLPPQHLHSPSWGNGGDREWTKRPHQTDRTFQFVFRQHFWLKRQAHVGRRKFETGNKTERKNFNCPFWSYPVSGSF